jgi:sphingomyelin phosphodiesterase acid-like 3
MFSMRSVAALLVVASFITGCSSSSSPAPQTVIAISDVHFDPFYDRSLFASLQVAPVTEWAALFASSTITDPGNWGGPTNYPLLQRMTTALRTQQPRPTLVIFGGDILVQDFPSIFHYLAPTQDEAAMKGFALKTVTFVVQQIRSALGTTPVYFTLGNWDSYAGSFGLLPNDPFLADTEGVFYDGLLAGAADRVAFLPTYRAGGYYAADVPGSSLVVVGLNTIFLAPQSPSGTEAAATQELEWLDATLDAARASGRPVWIVTHVPPGGDLATTGSDVDPQGHITQPTMMMQAGLQAELLAILAAHRDVVTAAFTGHTHMDEYRLAAIALQGLPGVTPLLGNSPAFKTFTISPDTTLEDYVSWTLDLGNPSATFQPCYTFSTAYGFAEPLASSLPALLPQLRSVPGTQAGYRERYGSGHAPSKPITDLNWPVYWCGIALLGPDGLTDCVNHY